MNSTPHKNSFIEKSVGVTRIVEFGETTTIVIINILVHDSQTQDRE